MGAVLLSLADVGLAGVAEAAERIGRGVREVQRLVSAGRLPAVVAGGGKRVVYLFRLADLDAFEPAPRGRPPAAVPEGPGPAAPTRPRAGKPAPAKNHKTRRRGRRTG